ncbi:MAG: diguanylate cyclase [Clostridiales bacterium]|nr:diguanylate cyclase [Clostridiales bacterium]
MSQLCEKETLRFDNRLNLVHHSVENINEYAKELQYLNGRMNVYSKEYEQHIKEFSIAVANQTDGALAVYFRYNPEVTGSGTDGFFWSKHSDTEKFEEEPPTDILAYNSSDVEHVGWFYIPKETGKSLWMTPYYNKNLNVFMISYIIPLYLDHGEFVGVIGMDIDFKTIINEAQGVQIYKSGSIALVDLTERLIYYSDDNGIVQNEELSYTLYNHITTINKFNELLEITDKEGNTSVKCCRKLSNGMMMFVSVPKSEIDSNRDYLMKICILITALIFVITSIVILRRTRRIIYPLEKLTEITKQYAEGDWSSQYISDTRDEVQKLSEGISKMAKNTQSYIEKLNNLARTDAITGIGNRTSYLEMVASIKENRDNQFDEYAVIAFDLNLLKKTNDTYGHEFGDLLIKEAAKYICRVFSKSFIFRTGGDEFVAILSTDDYKNRTELLKKFEEGMNYPLPDLPKVILSIAFGMAEYPKEHADYDSVFEHADKRMYRKKREMKIERRDRRQQ